MFFFSSVVARAVDTKMDIWIELYEHFQVLAGVLALLRHGPGTFEPYPL